jgi:hypothetical protein
VKGEQDIALATLEGKLEDVLAELGEGLASCQEILLPELFGFLYASDGVFDRSLRVHYLCHLSDLIIHHLMIPGQYLLTEHPVDFLNP